MTAQPTAAIAGRVTLLVENLSVPTDPRVWNEACVLRDAGYAVTVVGPIGIERDLERSVEIDGITVKRFPLQPSSGGVVSFIVEYLTALVRMAAIVWRSKEPIDVIHSANPPDFLFLIGLFPKLRWGTKLVFDHHDLVPELFEARFGQRGLPLRLIRLTEKLSFRTADAVISTNESYRRIAIERGGKSPAQVRVVRNARDRSAFRRVEADPTLKRGKPYLAIYVGVMGSQDGADVAVRAASIYRHQLGRDDLQVTFVGEGDQLAECRRLAAELDIEDMVHFAGWCEQAEVLRYLSTADIGAERAKRTLDVVGSVVLLVVLAPLMLAIAIAVRIGSPGPALFRQTRIGFAEQPFTILKFRTMAADNDPAIHRELVTSMLNGSIETDCGGLDGTGKFKLVNDPRVTRLGAFLRRTSLDELPQLFNVLRGQMSLVGARPSLAYEVEEYEPRHRLRAMSIPGMTGLWQVEGRSDLHMQEALDLDLDYVEMCSLAMDVKILVKTVKVFPGRSAA